MAALIIAAVALVPLVPLLTYCLMQEERRRLLLWGVTGGLVLTGTALVVLALLLPKEGDVAAFLLFLAGIVGGWLVGAYGGVALAELIGADVVRHSPAWDRRNGARAGALRGLGAGVVLTGAIALIMGRVSALALGVPVVPLSASAGTLLGAQVGAAARHGPARQRAIVRWQRLAIGLLAALVIAPLAWDRIEEEQARVRRAEATRYRQYADHNSALERLSSDSPTVRSEAAFELGDWFMLDGQGDDRIIPPLAEATRDEDASVRRAAVHALARTHSPQTVEPLGRVLQESDDPGLRYAALAALVNIRDSRVAPYVHEAAQDSDPRISRFAQNVIRAKARSR